MAGAVDKYAGAVVGAHHGFGDDTDAPLVRSSQIASGASVEETLVTAQGTLVATLGQAGEIVWKQHAAPQLAQHSVACRSQMSSMLRDTSRNDAYEAAIQRIVQRHIAQAGSKPTVLDVGAGAGLLSMLAARAGAGAVYGIEQWETMANLARAVIDANGLSDRVHIIASHSTAVGVAGERDSTADATDTSSKIQHVLPARADLVVSEILDSALLGEGVIPALKDAYGRLARAGGAKGCGHGVTASADGASTDVGSNTGTGGAAGAASAAGSNGSVHAEAAPAMCVPVRATLFAQLVHSRAAGQWQDTSQAVLRPGQAADGSRGADATTKLSMSLRDGCEALHPTIPVHASRLEHAGDLVVLTDPVVAARIDFTPSGPRFRSIADDDGAADSITEAVLHAPLVPDAVLGRAASGASMEAGAGQHGASAGNAAPSGTVTAANAVLWWWEVVLAEGTPDGQPPVIYSTAPGANLAQGWQDHWTQCLQPLPKPVHAGAMDVASPTHTGPAGTSAREGLGFTIVACHNDTRVWFYAGPAGACVWPSKRSHKLAEKKAKAAYEEAQKAGAFKAGDAAAAASLDAAKRAFEALSTRPALYTEPQPCTCGFHSAASLDRRWILTDTQRTAKYAAAVDGAVAAVLTARQQEASSLAEAAEAAGVDMQLSHSDSEPINVMDVTSGGLCALLALSSPAATAAGVPVRAFIPQSVPTTDASPRGSEGEDQMQDTAGTAAGADGAGDADMDANDDGGDADDGPVDPLRVHIQSVSNSAVMTGALPHDSQLVMVPAPPHACTPHLLGSVVAQLEDDENDEDDDGDGEDDDNDDAEDEALDGPSAGEDGHEDRQQTIVQPIKLDIIAGEPFIEQMASTPLWAAAAWWKRLHALKSSGALASACFLTPAAVTIMAQPVAFKHLHESFAPIRAGAGAATQPAGGSASGPVHGSSIVSGFHHGPFDDMQQAYHQYPFNLPLWQYEYEASGPAVPLLHVDFRLAPPETGRAWPSVEDLACVGQAASWAAPPTAAGDGPDAPAASNPYRLDGQCAAQARIEITQGRPGANAAIFWVEYDLSPVDFSGSSNRTPAEVAAGITSNSGHAAGVAMPGSTAATTAQQRLVVSTGPFGGDANAPGPGRQTVRFLPLQDLGRATAGATAITVSVRLDASTGAFETECKLEG